MTGSDKVKDAYDYEEHVRVIGKLRAAKNHVALHKARQTMSQHFALTPGMYAIN